MTWLHMISVVVTGLDRDSAYEVESALVDDYPTMRESVSGEKGMYSKRGELCGVFFESLVPGVGHSSDYVDFTDAMFKRIWKVAGCFVDVRVQISRVEWPDWKNGTRSAYDDARSAGELEDEEDAYVDE